MARPADPTVRDSLLRAGRAVLGRGGLQAARVADIALEAGVSKGAFYLHFHSKDELFREVILRFLGALEEHARRRAAEDSEPLSPPDLDAELRARVERDVEVLEMLWRNKEILRLLVEPDGAGLVEPIRLAREAIEAHVLARLQADQARGVLRAGLDAASVSDLILGAWERMAFRLPLLDRKPDFRRWAESIGSALNHGICTPSGES
jgi:AcrR family transcriptional regulator